jgi:predicted RNA-binding Zn-ribbon protein involved in translation (DUF1610 family)
MTTRDKRTAKVSMDFKVAKCPSCGGKLQIEVSTTVISCAYCGSTVKAQEVLSAQSIVRALTVATKLEKVRNHTPFDPYSMKLQTNVVLGLFSAFGLIALTLSEGSEIMILIGLVVLGLMPVVYTARTNKLSKIIAADEEFAKKGPAVMVIGYEGECPYCGTTVTAGVNVSGETCLACHKRYIIRDCKFFSIETPVTPGDSLPRGVSAARLRSQSRQKALSYALGNAKDAPLAGLANMQNQYHD